MRHFLVLLIFAGALFVPKSAMAIEAILGTVETPPSEDGETVIRILAPAGGAEAGDLIVLRLGETAGAETKAGLLVPGRTVRVWGDFLSGTPATFAVQAIRGGSPGRSGGDPTGVRSRLGRRPFPGRRSGRGGGGRR
jgi:hypothetical protein